MDFMDLVDLGDFVFHGARTIFKKYNLNMKYKSNSTFMQRWGSIAYINLQTESPKRDMSGKLTISKQE